MSRLRNRMVKAEFWTDPDLLAWPRDKRFFYMGLRSIAEDSGCNEDSPFGWMCVLYCSPYDRDISIEQVTRWRDDLVADGKLVRYSVAGKDYLFQTTFHDHEHPRNPQPPSIPLPPWVTWIGNEKDKRKGRYEVDTERLQRFVKAHGSVVQPLYEPCTTLPAQSSPVQPSPAPVLNTLVDADAPTGERPTSESDITKDFEQWWVVFGKVGTKADARDLYSWWRHHGASAEDLLAAATAYRTHCQATDCRVMHARTFLAKKPNRWAEWAAGEEHGSMDAAGSQRFNDVLTAITASSSEGPNGHHKSRYAHITAGPAGTPAVGPDARRGLPQGELEE